MELKKELDYFKNMINYEETLEEVNQDMMAKGFTKGLYF